MLLPLQVAAILLVFADRNRLLLVLVEIKVRHQLGFDVVDGFFEGIDKFIEVFFVQKQFVFLVGESIALRVAATLGDGDVIIAGAGRFYVEEIRALARPDPLGVQFFPILFFHNWGRLLVGKSRKNRNIMQCRANFFPTKKHTIALFYAISEANIALIR